MGCDHREIIIASSSPQSSSGVFPPPGKRTCSRIRNNLQHIADVSSRILPVLAFFFLSFVFLSFITSLLLYLCLFAIADLRLIPATMALSSRSPFFFDFFPPGPSSSSPPSPPLFLLPPPAPPAPAPADLPPPAAAAAFSQGRLITHARVFNRRKARSR